MPQTGLAQVLRQLSPERHPDLIVGNDTFDDAGVFRLRDDLALVQTLDFFPPLVDDPYTFGRIAATNALSDVYAMGGRPLTAMNIVGFPDKELEPQVLVDILRGGADAVHEAGAVVVGGHSVRDAEVKYGLSVTGVVNPWRVLTNAGARPGDVLILTKPIGSGTLTTAVKQGKLPVDELAECIGVMTTLNREACEAALAVGVNACTDVSGFGLIGHAFEMASGGRSETDPENTRHEGTEARTHAVEHGEGAKRRAEEAGACVAGHADASSHEGRGVCIVIQASRVPLMTHALNLARAGVLTRAHKSTREHLGDRLVIDPAVESALVGLLLDAQTSGGLLLAVPEDRSAALLAELSARGVTSAARVGTVTAAVSPSIRVDSGS